MNVKRHITLMGVVAACSFLTALAVFAMLLAQRHSFDHFRKQNRAVCVTLHEQVGVLIQLNRDWAYLQKTTTDKTIAASIDVRLKAATRLERLQLSCDRL